MREFCCVLSLLFQIVIAVMLFLQAVPARALAQEKEIVGWMEKVKIHPEGLIIHAKLDTGADYSSLNAEDIVQFTKKKSKTKWVRFTVSNRFGERITLERPIKREAKIKQHTGKTQSRPVIRLGICIGDAYMEEEVNIVNRNRFSSQMLVGRSFLAGTTLIDPAVTYSTQPSCAGAPKQ